MLFRNNVISKGKHHDVTEIQSNNSNCQPNEKIHPTPFIEPLGKLCKSESWKKKYGQQGEKECPLNKYVQPGHCRGEVCVLQNSIGQVLRLCSAKIKILEEPMSVKWYNQSPHILLFNQSFVSKSFSISVCSINKKVKNQRVDEPS